ncbi:MAG TPA: hypothetical protein VFE47_05400 [Tepidisphaeraceae bacterium]|jgi:hypothetical protein|nr:hypothetical protein [Tepidisphaeraceae bacterium]
MNTIAGRIRLPFLIVDWLAASIALVSPRMKSSFWKRIGILLLLVPWLAWEFYKDSKSPDSTLRLFRQAPVAATMTCLVFSATYVPLMWLMIRYLNVGRRRKKNGECVKCGYSLRGNVSGICPECGTKVAGE